MAGDKRRLWAAVYLAVVPAFMVLQAALWAASERRPPGWAICYPFELSAGGAAGGSSSVVASLDMDGRWAVQWAAVARAANMPTAPGLWGTRCYFAELLKRRATLPVTSRPNRRCPPGGAAAISRAMTSVSLRDPVLRACGNMLAAPTSPA